MLLWPMLLPPASRCRWKRSRPWRPRRPPSRPRLSGRLYLLFCAAYNAIRALFCGRALFLCLAERAGPAALSGIGWARLGFGRTSVRHRSVRVRISKKWLTRSLGAAILHRRNMQGGATYASARPPRHKEVSSWKAAIVRAPTQRHLPDRLHSAIRRPSLAQSNNR